MEDRTQLTVNGQELQQSDVNNLGKVSALADDRVLAELLRLAPFSGTVARAVTGFGYKGLPSSLAGLVRPSGNSGAVCVNAFRAIVGSRGTVAGIGAKDNWRDIRSGVFTNATGLTNDPTVALAANASGNPRWDLIYATLAVDANGPSVTRYVKNPTTLSTAANSLVATLVSSVTVGVVTGATGVTPVRPATPADSGSSYVFPLAYVRVPTGFGASSAVLAADINLIAPMAHPAASSGAASCRVATSNNQPSQMVAAYRDAWSVGTYRSPTYLPADMVGATELVVLINGATCVNGSLVDDSIDWSRRIFKWQANYAYSTTGYYDSDSTTTPMSTTPALNASGIGNSFSDTLGTSQSAVVDLTAPGTFPTNVYLGSLPAAGRFGLYVDRTTGNLRCFSNLSGANSFYLTIWLTASGPFANA